MGARQATPYSKTPKLAAEWEKRERDIAEWQSSKEKRRRVLSVGELDIAKLLPTVPRERGQGGPGCGCRMGAISFQEMEVDL